MRNKLFIFAFAAFSLFAVNANAVDVKIVSANGVQAWLIEDHILPIISIDMAFKNAGSAHDPDGKEGTSYQIASMLNEGAGEYSSQEYQKLLEENAINFVPSADKDNFYISVKTLSENLNTAIDLTNLAITKPKFNDNDYSRIKSETLTVLSKEDESEGAVAQKTFEKIMFGTHAYSKHKVGSISSVEKITPADLHEYVQNNFGKDNMLISIVGDVDEAGAKTILEKLTQNMPEKSKNADLPLFGTYAPGGVTDVKMDNPQTYVMFGEQGLARGDKDYYAAYILNHILGGEGFSARLMTEVREKNGLAYSVGTDLENSDKADLYLGVVSSKNQTVDQAINIIKQEFKKISDNGITAAELKDAKDFITGSFGLNLDKNENLAAFLISMQIYHLGPDYLNKRNDYFKSVKVDQVNAVAKRLVRPESLVFIKVGP